MTGAITSSLVELFKADLPSPSVASELRTWSIKFTNCDQTKLPSSPLQALIQCDEEAQGYQRKISIKKPNSGNKRPEKGQTDCLKARKKQNCSCVVTMPSSQKTFKLQE